MNNQIDAFSLTKLTIEQNFGKNSEAARFIIDTVLSIFNSTKSEAAMLRAAYAISEIKDNIEEAKMCSLYLSNMAKSTKIATDVILAAEQLVQNKGNLNARMLLLAISRKAE